MTRSLLEEAAKVLRSELTAGQKKLPPALQKAIKDKEDKKDEEMDPKKDMVNKTKKGMEEMMPMNAKKDHKKRNDKNKKIFDQIMKLMKNLKSELNGDEKYLLGNCINFSVPNVDAEAFMLTTKDLISVSNGSACTS